MTTETQLSYTQLWDRYKAQEKRITDLEDVLKAISRMGVIIGDEASVPASMIHQVDRLLKSKSGGGLR